MADTYYAWSTFSVPDTSKPGAKPKVFNPGDTVTAAGLGVEKEEFDAMVEAGSIRTMKWPVPPEAGAVSPIDYLKAKAAEAEEKDLDSIVEEIAEVGPPPGI